MKSTLFRSVSLLAFASAALAAQADLTGATIHGTYYFPSLGDQYADLGSATVGAGEEFFTVGGTPYNMDFTGSTLTLTAFYGASYSSGSFNGVVIDVTTGPTFTSVTYTGGDDQPNAWVSGGKLYIDWRDITVTTGETASFRFTTSDISSVPGPAAIVPFVLGGVATLRRRRKA